MPVTVFRSRKFGRDGILSRDFLTCYESNVKPIKGVASGQWPLGPRPAQVEKDEDGGDATFQARRASSEHLGPVAKRLN